MQNSDLSPSAKIGLRRIFLILYLDLVGFSLIFPLFPKILEYYGSIEGSGGLFTTSMGHIAWLRQHLGGSGTLYDIVLFGGFLGSLYSLMQFVFSPILGGLSDRLGRKPVLIITVAGTCLSYLIWIFADSFLALVLSRLLGGIMAANISTASAVVADLTNKEQRAKGMAVIGIAFGLGFITGPALGAILAQVDPSQLWPALVPYGINPFSLVAAGAFLLSLINFFWLLFRFEETLPPGGPKESILRCMNPFALFKATNNKAANRNTFIYFLYLLAFSGMEFTLTFLTYEKFSYGHMSQGLMFLYIGFWLIIVQGGYVRRAARKVGERLMAIRGLILLIPGFVLIGIASPEHHYLLYLGLFLMAIGSAQVTPCLTALASLYSAPHEQGQLLGIFRSLGSLARALGPLLASFVYWKLGATSFYMSGGLFILIPIFFMGALPNPPKEDSGFPAVAKS